MIILFNNRKNCKIKITKNVSFFKTNNNIYYKIYMKGVKSLLSSRGNNIIKSLCKNNGEGTIKELAKLLNISERSIR